MNSLLNSQLKWQKITEEANLYSKSMQHSNYCLGDLQFSTSFDDCRVYPHIKHLQSGL